MATRVARSLSYWNLSTLKWIAIPSKSASSQVRQSQLLHGLSPTSRFSIITWNIDALDALPIKRAKSLFEYILEESRKPDIIFLQEVKSDVRASLLNNPNVREAFFTTDAEDDASFKDKGFATMTLLSSKRFASSFDSQKEGDEVEGEEKFVVGPVSRVELPSVFGRDGLCVDIIPPSDPDIYYRLINVHLDSLENLHTRTRQLEILTNSLREPGCSGGLIAGDFNSVNPGDAELIDKNGLVDAWLALHGRTNPEGPTWGVGRMWVPGLNPRRLDKVALMGWTPKEIEILHPGSVDVPVPGGDSKSLELSDHSGLKCTFTI